MVQVPFFDSLDLTLKANEVHLWLAFPDEIQDAELKAAYKKLMTQEERTQQQRFHFAKHRHQYLITRALVRTTLSHYTRIKPHEWRFSKNYYGRPEIIIKEYIPPLRFNLSHTDGLIVCGVVLKQDIGVDIENLKRQGAPVEIADRFFSTQEVNDLYSLSKKQKRDRFFDYWILKESYIKARGMGLSLPLNQFSFHILDNMSLHISFDPQLDDDPDLWQFWLLELTQHHKVAISLRRENKKVFYRLTTVKKIVPLKEESSYFCNILYQS